MRILIVSQACIYNILQKMSNYNLKVLSENIDAVILKLTYCD